MAKFPDLRKFADPLGLGPRPNEPETATPNVQPQPSKTTNSNPLPAGIKEDPNSSGIHFTSKPHPASNEVAQMQQQIINIYNLFKQSSIFSDKAFGPNQSANPGIDSFKSFLMNHYIKPNLNNPTAQLPLTTTSPNPRPLEQNEPLSHLIDTFKNVGTIDKNGPKPDGKWGPQTNRALINLKGIIKGLQEFASKLVASVSFSKDLDKLDKYIPQDSQLLKQPNETAKLLIPVLTEIQGALPEFIKRVELDTRFTNNNALSSEQKSRYQLTDFDKQEMGKADPWFPLVVSENGLGEGIESPKLNISLYDLQNQRRFNQFVINNNIVVDGQPVITMVGKTDKINNQSMAKLLMAIEQKIKNIGPYQGSR